jgi:hypothetical protein
MRRERALKIVLVLVGLLFTALVYPLVLFVKQEPALAMMLSLYVTLGIFLLLASSNPSANRSLIAFTAWSSFAHAAVMGLQAFRNLIPRGEPIGVAVLIVIGVAFDRAGSGEVNRPGYWQPLCRQPDSPHPEASQGRVVEYAKLQ